jgi:hypothetical protein
MGRMQKSSARRRALRAARAVTMSLGIGGLGCSSGTVQPDLSAPRDLSFVVPDQREPPDLAEPEDLAAPADLRADLARPDLMPFDLGCPDGGMPDTNRACCEQIGGIWTPGGGCAVPGPFVPPSLPA